MRQPPLKSTESDVHVALNLAVHLLSPWRSVLRRRADSRDLPSKMLNSRLRSLLSPVRCAKGLRNPRHVGHTSTTQTEEHFGHIIHNNKSIHAFQEVHIHRCTTTFSNSLCPNDGMRLCSSWSFLSNSPTSLPPFLPPKLFFFLAEGPGSWRLINKCLCVLKCGTKGVDL